MAFAAIAIGYTPFLSAYTNDGLPYAGIARYAILATLIETAMGVRSEFHIAVMPGDGVGIEVVDACLAILDALTRRIAGVRLATEILPGGAAHYRETGVAFPDKTVKETRKADAILFGAMGLPEVRMPNGTEVNPQIDLRFELELYAGVRPVKAMTHVRSALADPRATNIDLVIVREQSEGFFAAFRNGKIDDDRAATDRCVITRTGTARVVDFAFRLAERRRQSGHPGLITCVDKANVMTSMAFFRKIFDERSKRFSKVQADRAYIDATALNLVRRPWDFDVIVTENLCGDILSDLAAGLVGGLGMAPSADIGDNHAMFQPCHGSAPDIAGTGHANPTAMFLSAAMMLDGLGDRHGSEACSTAAQHLRAAIESGFRAGRIRPYELGGTDGTAQITTTLIDIIKTHPVVT